MLKCTIDHEQLKSLNGLIGSKNEISVLKSLPTKDALDNEKEEFKSKKILDSNGSISNEVQPLMDVLANPYGVVKYIFTGGVGIYEHSVSYDNTFKKPLQLILTPDTASIDDEVNAQKVINIMENFIGKSNIKSLNISNKLDVAEALVVAAIIDMERKASLRSFIDEAAYSQNSYSVNVIWRMVNSTNPSIQWFVYLINEVVGEHEPLSQSRIQEAVNQLIEKGIVIKKGEQYLLSEEFSLLSNRMVIVDNVISVQTYKKDGSAIINSGFTCIQAGVHDLLLLDYDGNTLQFKTITSSKLIEYVEHIMDSEKYFENLKA